MRISGLDITILVSSSAFKSRCKSNMAACHRCVSTGAPLSGTDGSLFSLSSLINRLARLVSALIRFPARILRRARTHANITNPPTIRNWAACMFEPKKASATIGAGMESFVLWRKWSSWSRLFEDGPTHIDRTNGYDYENGSVVITAVLALTVSTLITGVQLLSGI